jgi:hypothetical protein
MYAIPCERTSLMAYTKRTSQDEDAYGDTEEAKELDKYFGKWPWRLLNWQVRLPTVEMLIAI